MDMFRLHAPAQRRRSSRAAEIEHRGPPGRRWWARARPATLALAALAAAWLAMPPGYGDGTRTIEVVIRGGQVAGEKSVRVTQGDTVILRWRSDTRLELHLHGYDVETTVGPEMPAEMKIEARAAGRFPVEIHAHGAAETSQGHGHGHGALFYLEVYPD